MWLTLDRPQKTGLTEYLASLKRTNDNLQTLKTTNLRSQQTAIQQMTTLLKTGALELENLFRQALAEESNPIEPLSLVLKGRSNTLHEYQAMIDTGQASHFPLSPRKRSTCWLC